VALGPSARIKPSWHSGHADLILKCDLDHSALLLRGAYSDAMIHESPVAMRLSSRRGARIANERRMAALCQRRASDWADALRDGLDSDIARFIRDQAAWRLLANSYGGCPETAR
jgi:hypothetical protein